MHIIVTKVDSTESIGDGDWHPPLFIDAESKEAGMTIERLSRQIFHEFAPRKAPPFTNPPPGVDPVSHTAAENAVAERAFKERGHFRLALQNIVGVDTIFQLVPREAHATLFEIRRLLLNHFPEVQR